MKTHFNSKKNVIKKCGDVKNVFALTDNNNNNKNFNIKNMRNEETIIKIKSTCGYSLGCKQKMCLNIQNR